MTADPGDIRPSGSFDPDLDPGRARGGAPVPSVVDGGRIRGWLRAESTRRVTRAFALGVAAGLFLLRRARTNERTTKAFDPRGSV